MMRRMNEIMYTIHKILLKVKRGLKKKHDEKLLSHAQLALTKASGKDEMRVKDLERYHSDKPLANVATVSPVPSLSS